jgi:membrane-bound lytic murein transglycosylase D
MAKNPQQYGLEGLVPDAPVLSDTVTVDYAVDLRLAADVTDASLQEIVALNPSLLRMSTPGDMDFDLHLPAGTRDVYLKRIEKVPEDKRSSWRFHVVRAGESLDSIASSLHSRAAEIVSANGLDANALIQAGDELAVPVANVTVALRTLHYTTRTGDTLVTVADRFNVSVEDLRRWNHLSSSKIGPHRTLAVSEPVHLAPATHVRAKKAQGKATAKTEAGTTKKSASGAAKPAAKTTAKTTAKHAAKTSSRSATKKKTAAAKKHSTSK